MPRPDFQTPQGAIAIQPVQTGAQVYTQPPDVQRQIEYSTVDLAPISRSFRDIQARANASDYKYAQKYLLEHSSDIAANRKQFREDVAAGKISELNNPWGRVLFEELDAKGVVDDYQAALLKKVPEWSAFQADGHASQPPDLNQEFAKIWQPFSQQFSVSTAYGATVANRAKEQAEGAIRHLVLHERLSNEIEGNKVLLAEQGTRILKEVPDEYRDAVWQSLFTNAHEYGTTEIQSIQTKAVNDFLNGQPASKALSWIVKAGDLPWGGTSKLSENPKFPEWSLSLYHRMQTEADLADRAALQRQQDFERILNTNAFPTLYAASKDPQKWNDELSRFKASIETMPPDLQRTAANWIQGVEASQRNAKTQENEQVFQGLVDRLDAGEDPATIQKARSDMRAQLTFQQQKDLDAAIDRRITNSDVYEGRGYKNYQSMLVDSPKTFLPGADMNSVHARSGLENDLVNIRDNFQADLNAEIETAKTSPTRDTDIALWIQKRTLADKKEVERLARERGTQFKEFWSKLREQEARKMDTSALLSSEEGGRFIHPEQLAKLSERDTIAASPTNDYKLDDVRRRIRTEIASAMTGGYSIKNAEQVVSDDQIKKATDYFEEAYADRATAIRQDSAKYPTAAIGGAFQRAKLQSLQEAAQYALGKKGPYNAEGGGPESQPARPARPAQPGVSKEQAAIPPEDRAIQFQKDIRFANGIGDPDAYRASFAKAIPAPVNENGDLVAPPEFFQAYKRFLVHGDPAWETADIRNQDPSSFSQFIHDYLAFASGDTRPYGEGQTVFSNVPPRSVQDSTAAMDATLRHYAHTVLSGPGSDDAKKLAVVNMYQWWGLKPEMIEKGEIEVKPDPRLESMIAKHASMISGDPLANADPTLFYFLSRARSFKVKIDGSEFDPWTADYGFDDPIGFAKKEPARAAAFLQKIGVPPEKAQDFWSLQNFAKERNRRR